MYFHPRGETRDDNLTDRDCSVHHATNVFPQSTGAWSSLDNVNMFKNKQDELWKRHTVLEEMTSNAKVDTHLDYWFISPSSLKNLIEILFLSGLAGQVLEAMSFIQMVQ